MSNARTLANLVPDGLDDYETGSWNPTFTTSGTQLSNVIYDAVVTGAKYTKIGNVVHVQASIRTSSITIGSASGILYLSGLPFIVISNDTGQDGWAALSLSQAANFSGDAPSGCALVAGTYKAELYYRLSSNAGTADLLPSDLNSGTSGNMLRIAGTYITT